MRVIIKEYKIHPITRNFLHADFYAISPEKAFTTEIPMNYTGTPVGVKRAADFISLQAGKDYTDIENLPKSIEVDISELKINQYLDCQGYSKGQI